MKIESDIKLDFSDFLIRPKRTIIEKYSYNRKYNIKFFIRTKLEKTTLENII